MYIQVIHSTVTVNTYVCDSCRPNSFGLTFVLAKRTVGGAEQSPSTASVYARHFSLSSHERLHFHFSYNFHTDRSNHVKGKLLAGARWAAPLLGCLPAEGVCHICLIKTKRVGPSPEDELRAVKRPAWEQC